MACQLIVWLIITVKKTKNLEAFKHFLFCLPFMILLHIRMCDLRHRARRTVKCGRVDLPNLCTGSCSWCNSLLWPGSPPSSGRRAARSSPPRSDLSCTRNLRLHSPKRRGDIQGKDLEKNSNIGSSGEVKIRSHFGTKL